MLAMRSFTVILLLVEMSLSGVMMGFGLTLLAGAVSISTVTPITESNLNPFIKLWGTTAIYLLIVGTQLVFTIILLYSFLEVDDRKYRELDQDNLDEDMATKIRHKVSCRLRKRCAVWLMVAIPNLLFVASQFFWAIPIYQYFYYGVLIGFRLLVIGAVVNFRREISMRVPPTSRGNRDFGEIVEVFGASSTKIQTKNKWKLESGKLEEPKALKETDC